MKRSVMIQTGKIYYCYCCYYHYYSPIFVMIIALKKFFRLK